MKPFYLLPIPILAIAIGWLRQPELERLRYENDGLQAAAPAPKFKSDRRPPPSAPLSESKRMEIVGMAREIQRIGEESGPQAASTRDLRKRFRAELSLLGRSEVMALIGQSTDGLDTTSRTKLMDTYVHAFIDEAPAEALLMVMEMRDYAARDFSLTLGLNRCAQADPALAIRIFSQLEAEGHAVTKDSVVLPGILAARARLEPEILVSYLASGEVTTRVGGLPGLAGRIGQELRNPEEHRAFLAALRTQAAKFPGSVAIGELRDGYVSQLAGQITGWPYDEAVLLVNAEFTPAEKASLLPLLRLKSEEPGRWVDWVAKLEQPAGREHPIGEFVRTWMEQDRAAARTWLEEQPESPVRDTALKNYALNLVNTDPAEAADAAMKLPAGENRGHAFAVIRSVWKKKDPAAWSAFASNRGLKQ